VLEKCLEPAQFNVYSEFDEGKLGKVGAQRVTALGITAINRTDGSQLTDFSDRSLRRELVLRHRSREQTDRGSTHAYPEGHRRKH